MVLLRLANYNTRRLLRHKGLRVAFLVVPLAVALLRAILAGNAVLRYAAELCPFVCALMIGAVLYSQWSVDSATGLAAGLRSCPIPGRAVVASRVISGASIFAGQMLVFGLILILRF